MLVATVGSPAAADRGGGGVIPSYPKPTKSCGPANVGETAYVVDAVEVNPTLTHFLAVHITAGTTGEHAETLSTVNEVTTSVSASIEITAKGKFVLAEVETKVGFTVQKSTSTTNSESVTDTWNFSQPGYYGLYKGTRAVEGTWLEYRCQRLTSGGTTTYPFWFQVGNLESYTTFSVMEVGTIGCQDSPPAGSVRFQARLYLGC
ncbi:hypothetical protein [Micromonospora chokoriensis]|uniref:hypothetical protein n=1 Tax=Micromonospora chokoriensis TaxID=356851 RepID=UPI0004C34903|nr:hypothetical protein [Micromonospora chokoriensis]